MRLMTHDQTHARRTHDTWWTLLATLRNGADP